MKVTNQAAADGKNWISYITEHRYRAAALLMVLALLLPVLAIYGEEKRETVFSETEDAIFETLVNEGYTTAGACGILGNISVENPQFEPDLYANGRITYGLFQWSDAGGRKSFLKKWCNNRLLHYDRADGQIAYALYELNGGDHQASRANDYLKTTTDPKMAAMEFCVGFERCIGSTGNDEADGLYIGSVYPERFGCTYQALSRRVANAQNYYDGYYGSSLSPDVELDIKGTPTAGIIAEQEDAVEYRIVEDFPIEDDVSDGVLMAFRGLSLLIGYLFGCIVGAGVIVRSVRDKQRLRIEEKLPGLLTVLRHFGIRATLLAAVIDTAKFFLALGLVYLVTKGALGHEQILWTGFGVILGNDFPFWHRFRGGMGIMVTTIFLCTYMPIWGLECCLLGLVVALLTRSLPFGAICITLFAVPYGFFLRGTEAGIFITAALLLLLIRHFAFLRRFIGRDLLRRHYRRRRVRAV